MAKTLLSDYERKFILDGIASNLREDGRARDDYRHFSLQTGLITNANGSARVRLWGTDILVAVKADATELQPGQPDQGRIEFSVECSPSASPDFSSRGGDALANEITQTLARLAENPSTLSLQELCIIPGKYAWIVYVDVVIMECSAGNIFDCIGLATKAALSVTTIPVVELTGNGVDEPLDFELSDDPQAVQKLSAQNFPLLVTLTKIGTFFVVDASAEEESCVNTTVILAVNPLGNICSLQKTGLGAVAPATLSEMLTLGRSTAKQLETQLHDSLQLDSQIVRRKTGFL